MLSGKTAAAFVLMLISFGSLTASEVDRGLRLAAEDKFDAIADTGGEASLPPARLRELMRPQFQLGTDWLSPTNDLGITSYDGSVQFPLYPIFGPPPPMLRTGFRFTDLDGSSPLGLPARLYETRLNLGWMRIINDRWVWRFMAGTTYATDNSNTTSDAWRFTGGAFAIFKQNPRWTWTFGAIALGRNDLPVLPAIGVIHQPHAGLRYDLVMPRPRVSFLVADRGPRQQWVYVGAGLQGATWGVERDLGTQRLDDQLTYGDVRAVIGWESVPTPEPGMPFARGRQLRLEAGYAFSRDFEWESDEAKIPLDDTFLINASVRF